jgi:hypothetical protein
LTIDTEDLDAAVAAGVLPQAQADALRAFATERSGARDAAIDHDDEHFRFMTGFNDFFFAVGIVLFVGGLGFFALPTPAGSLAAAILIWVLAELLVGRLRLVLPGILLACSFVAFATAAAPVDLWFFSPGPLDFPQIERWFTAPRFTLKYYATGRDALPLMFVVYLLVGAAAAALIYLRFKLPFALLAIAGCLVGTVMVTVALVWPEHFDRYHAPVLLGCGLLTFVAAMTFDVFDRERRTRRADCAFWLHLLAAPLIVHSLISLVTPDFKNLTTPVAGVILAIFAVLTIVAVLIDRRALLVSSLIYVGSVIAYAVSGTVVGQTNRQEFAFYATLIVLGTLVLTLGVGWRVLRRLFIRLMPVALSKRLPPEAAAA